MRWSGFDSASYLLFHLPGAAHQTSLGSGGFISTDNSMTSFSVFHRAATKPAAVGTYQMLDGEFIVVVLMDPQSSFDSYSRLFFVMCERKKTSVHRMFHFRSLSQKASKGTAWSNISIPFSMCPTQNCVCVLTLLEIYCVLILLQSSEIE